MDMRKLSAALLGIAIAVIIIALAISDWSRGLAFNGAYHDKDAMTAVTFLIIIGLICLIIVFILDVVMLCQTAVPAGMITARFVMLYIGVVLIMIGVLVYTARRGGYWPYFLVVVGTVFAILVAILAAVSSKCVSRERVVVVRSTR